MGKQWKQWQTIFLGSKITADGDCSHEIKRCLLLARKAMTNLGSILKSRDITLSTKVCLVKTMVFPVVIYGYELDYKESWVLKNWCIWTVVLEKTLESPLDCREIQPVHHKRKSVLNIYWKNWCWSWNSNTLATWCEELTHWKRPWCWERLKAGGKGDDRRWDGWMASPAQWTWVWVNSRSLLEAVNCQGGLACCNPLSHKETWLSDWTEVCSPPGSSIHGILQARMLEWVAISFSRLKALV